jgi:hypothetical protein
MNAVTSPLTWSFLTSFGMGQGVLPAATALVKPVPKPAAFDPALCADMVTGSESAEPLSAEQETRLAWFLTEDAPEKEIAPRAKTAKRAAQATVAAHAFFSAMQAMSCRAKAQAQT